MRFSACLIVAVSVVLGMTTSTPGVTAFVGPTRTGRSSVPTCGTALHAMRSRRNIFRNLLTATIAAFVRTAPAVADETTATAPQDANVILLEIQNLDGVEGSSGQVKIQMRPDWAPRGVQRFEVSMLQRIRTWSVVDEL